LSPSRTTTVRSASPVSWSVLSRRPSCSSRELTASS